MTERQMQLEDWLDDLCVRFVINLPVDDLSSVERICFQVEEAQWYYEDFIRPLDPNLPSLSLRNFCLRIFAHCPLLSNFVSEGRHMQAFEEFLTYKKRIPVRGAIMLNEAMDAAVLVKGWKKGANWSFPRGKINKDEDDLICAIREVYEETGYDIQAAGLVPEDRQVKYIEVNMREQQMRLYIFRDVPMDTYFEPRTRKEISKIQWWCLSELPAFRKKSQQEQPEAALNANKFYMVAPFLVPLRKWVVEQKKRDAKRTISNQYLSAGMSHDEFMTEEDRGEESSTQAPPNAYAPAPGASTLQEATAALSRLLKIQPPTHGLQPEAMIKVQSPATANSGQALLALLQSKPFMLNQPLPLKSLPQTPLDPTMGKASTPKPPHHQHPRPPHFSSRPPPKFPIQPPNEPSSYHLPDSHNHEHRQPMVSLQQGCPPVPQQPSWPQEDPHSYQSQHLIHPQPLPPHVQRAVFAGGAVHTSMAPQPISQSHVPKLSSSVPVPISNPQLPVLNASMVPTFQKLSPPKLTSHSLALLNAFKSRDQAIGQASTINELPLQRYTQGLVLAPLAQPQELPAEILQPIPLDPQPTAMLQQNSDHTHQGPFAPRKPISEIQRSTLLGMFKTLDKAALPVKVAAATTLPTGDTPSAVELSAVEPLSSNAASTSAFLNEKRSPDSNMGNGGTPKMNPEANLPFRAISILTRPSSSSDKEGSANGPSSQKTIRNRNGKKPIPPNGNGKKMTSAKLFQPQILKRPQLDLPKTMVSPMVAPMMAPANLTTPSPQIPLERLTTHLTGHRKPLLSLFGKSLSTTNPLSKVSPSGNPSASSPVEPLVNTATRSRVGSLTSADAVSRRGSQTQISPADKGFLLSYLDAVANGSQR